MQFPKLVRDAKAFGLLTVIVIVILVIVGFYLSNLQATQGLADCQGIFLTDGCNTVNQNELAPVYNGTARIDVNLANYTAMNGTIPSYAQEFKQNNTIIFHSMNISIVALANTNVWVSAVTNTSLLSVPHSNISQFSNAFAIYHMYSPTLVIPRGATVNITLINMDYGDNHNFVISTFPPPYPMYIMQNMKTGGAMIAMTPLINPIDNSTNTASLFSYTVVLNLSANVTHMWYLCMFPTHAMTGMWGNITLVDPSSVGA
jgi:rusticyanin